MSSTLPTPLPTCFLTHFQPPREDSLGGGGNSAPGGSAGCVEMWALPHANLLSSFPVTSTVRGSTSAAGSSSSSSGAATGKLDLLAPFGSFVAATFSDSNRLVIYSLLTQAKHNQSTLPERARCMCVDAAGRYLLIGSASGRLRIYSLASGALLRELRTHHDRGINKLLLDAGESRVIMGGEDGVVSVYDFGMLIQQSVGGGAPPAQQSVAQAALLLSISDHSLAITSLYISDSNHLLTASKDGSVRVYKLDQPMQAEAQARSTGSASHSSAHSPLSPPCLFTYSFRSSVAAAVMDVTESIIYVACKENIHWIPMYASALTLPRTHASALAASSAASSSSLASSIPLHTWYGHQSPLLSLHLSPSSSHLLSLDSEGHLKLWDCGSPAGSSPPATGSCIKNLPRRPGCKSISLVDARDLATGSSRVATQNTWTMAHQAKAAQGGVHANTGLRESSWIFPPLQPPAVLAQAQQAQPFLFVSVPLTPLQVQNQELKRLRRTKRRRQFGQLGSGLQEELECDTTNKYLKQDWELMQGTSGWFSLAESVSSRGTTVDLLQSQVESYEANMQEMYQLCVDKIWKEIKE